MPLDVSKPTASTSLPGCDIWKPLDEDPALATSVIAAVALNSDRDHYGATLPWKVGKLAIVSAVDPLLPALADWAPGKCLPCVRPYRDLIFFSLDLDDSLVDGHKSEHCVHD